MDEFLQKGHVYTQDSDKNTPLIYVGKSNNLYHFKTLSDGVTRILFEIELVGIRHLGDKRTFLTRACQIAELPILTFSSWKGHVLEACEEAVDNAVKIEDSDEDGFGKIFRTELRSLAKKSPFNLVFYHSTVFDLSPAYNELQSDDILAFLSPSLYHRWDKVSEATFIACFMRDARRWFNLTQYLKDS